MPSPYSDRAVVRIRRPILGDLNIGCVYAQASSYRPPDFGSQEAKHLMLSRELIEIDDERLQLDTQAHDIGIDLIAAEFDAVV